MLEIFSYIIICIATIWTLVSFAGYLFYKTQHLDSWTDGLKDVFNTGKSIMSIIGKGVVSCMQFCYTELTGKLPDGQIINPTLMLTNKEAIELTNRFKGVRMICLSWSSFFPTAMEYCGWRLYQQGYVLLMKIFLFPI